MSAGQGSQRVVILPVDVWRERQVPPFHNDGLWRKLPKDRPWLHEPRRARHATNPQFNNVLNGTAANMAKSGLGPATRHATG